MNKSYTKAYYENYAFGSKTINYKKSKEITLFFQNAARLIVNKYHPKTVLDVGCAMGGLVEQLRILGVEAYGIDVSQYALKHVIPGVKSFCENASILDSLPENFPKSYDMITCLDVLEELSEKDAKTALKKMCKYSDRLMLCTDYSVDAISASADAPGSTDRLISQFFKNGFYHYIDNENTVGLFSADLFVFETLFDDCDEIVNKNLVCYSCGDQKRDFEQQDEVDTEEENEEIEELKEQLEYITSLYFDVTNAWFWKITGPFRSFSTKMKILLNKNKFTRIIFKSLKVFLREGIRGIKRRIRARKNSWLNIDYSKISKTQRNFESSYSFPKNIKFSILVPLYNTPITFLSEMIESVQAQTYSNWELCLADGSDAEHDEVRQRVMFYQKNDNRIVYKKLEKNLGISENTNECIKMATGDYIGLFDHDDILHPSVLFENAKAICEHGADFLYTDEATFESPNIKKLITFHFKPDFAIDNLLANNYICHFSVFSRQLLEKAGMFRKEFDGSQDHDMILRLTANAKKVYHIRKLLYFWRSHPQSVAMDIGAKKYAIDAGKRAVYEMIKAKGYDCTVESSKAFPTIYRIKYALKINPLVSIIIPNMNHKADLKRCIESILSKTTYDNYEVIVIENNSTESEIFNYYKEIEENHGIRVLKYDGEFNYSLINNFGAEHANGEYLILLNNDTSVITPAWIEEMLMFAQRSDVGVVGVKLNYPDNTIQHAGIIVGLGGIAAHTHRNAKRSELGYMGIMYYAHDLSAVTAACLMVKKSLFEQVGGLDSNFAVAYNDIDFCLRIRELDKLVVYTPYAELYHYESKSRGYEKTPAKKKRFSREIELFHEKWDDKILSTGDPYYNPNFSLSNDYEILYSKINSHK